MTASIPRLLERVMGKSVYVPVKHIAKRLLCLLRGLTDTGRNVYVSPLARVVGASRIRMGNDVVAYRHVVLHASVEGSVIEIGEGTALGDYASLYAIGGFIKIGRGCSVNTFCVLYGHGGLTIGDGVSIAAHTVIVPANHMFDDTGVPIKLQGETKKGIRIGDDVWIGANVTVLDGVTIGSGSVVGAGSVVTRDIPPMAVAAGNPARVIRRRGEPR